MDNEIGDVVSRFLNLQKQAKTFGTEVNLSASGFYVVSGEGFSWSMDTMGEVDAFILGFRSGVNYEQG